MFTSWTHASGAVSILGLEFSDGSVERFILCDGDTGNTTAEQSRSSPPRRLRRPMSWNVVSDRGSAPGRRHPATMAFRRWRRVEAINRLDPSN
jgi:hypothetical protein